MRRGPGPVGATQRALPKRAGNRSPWAIKARQARNRAQMPANAADASGSRWRQRGAGARKRSAPLASGTDCSAGKDLPAPLHCAARGRDPRAPRTAGPAQAAPTCNGHKPRKPRAISISPPGPWRRPPRAMRGVEIMNGRMGAGPCGGSDARKNPVARRRRLPAATTWQVDRRPGQQALQRSSIPCIDAGSVRGRGPGTIPGRRSMASADIWPSRPKRPKRG